MRTAELDPDNPAPRGHRGGGRVFAHGGLRLLLLQLIADKPRHGYELIKDIADRLGGRYSPSPGVVYPTLTQLEDMGLIAATDSTGTRKCFAVTPAGQAHLAGQRSQADALLARMATLASHHAARPPQVVRALENFKLAMRLRLDAPLSDAQAHAIAQVLDQAAQAIEQI